MIAGVTQGNETVSNLESGFLTKSGELHIGLVSAEVIELNGEDCMVIAINDCDDAHVLLRQLS